MLNIGEAAEASGVSAKMIRHYEAIGLVARPRRSSSGYRLYRDADVHVLRFVKRARNLGFTIEEIGKLLGLWHDRRRASADVKKLAAKHVAELEQRISEMQAMRRSLAQLIEHCHGDHRPDCPILDDLAGENPR